MAADLTVSFIICTYNRAYYLADTLASLINNISADHLFEIIVIDNNSTDDTPEVIKEYSNANPDIDLRYFKEKQQGLSFARNRGIRESNSPYVVFLDDDIFASPTLIPAWISFFEEQPDVTAAGGKIHVQFDDPRPSWMSHFLLPLLGYHDLGDSRKKYPSNKYPFGGNMGFKKDIFEEVGYFDTELGRKGESLKAGEEKELFNRIRSRSHDIYYVPDAFLYHRVGAKRLTKEYIRGQATGLGESMKLQMNNAGNGEFIRNWTSEFVKMAGSVLLALFYLLKLNPAKAGMLFQFRWWIWKGYWQYS